jgi:hypothetical protein
VNANDATLTALTTAQTGSTVADTAPNAPASPGFDLILQAAAGSALGSGSDGPSATQRKGSPMRKSFIAVPVLAASALLASAVPAFADAGTVYSNNSAGVEYTCASGVGCGSVQTEDISLPAGNFPNQEGSLIVTLQDAQQTVVAGVAPNYNSSGVITSWVGGVQVMFNDPSETTGYSQFSTTSFPVGDNVLIQLSDNPSTGNVNWSVSDLTNITVPAFSGTFLDANQTFTTAFAGPSFAYDVYGQPGAWTQPTTNTQLTQFKDTVITDNDGNVIAPADWYKVQTRAGAVKQGKLLANSTVGKTFTVTMEGSS